VTEAKREWVVLVDEADREIGVAPKDEVHHGATPLHRAFSLFLFDSRGRALAQRRALSKRTWPGIWSNACCGHPAPGESTMDAVRRRGREELGAAPLDSWLALPDYRYRAELDGVVENEICPVAVGRVDPARLAPDPAEVAELAWWRWDDLLRELANDRGVWSPWCREEAARLDALPAFRAWLGGLTDAGPAERSGS
jgi:isopentenyl-diphosphate delta-isomerase type 1